MDFVNIEFGVILANTSAHRFPRSQLFSVRQNVARRSTHRRMEAVDCRRTRLPRKCDQRRECQLSRARNCRLGGHNSPLSALRPHRKIVCRQGPSSRRSLLDGKTDLLVYQTSSGRGGVILKQYRHRKVSLFTCKMDFVNIESTVSPVETGSK